MAQNELSRGMYPYATSEETNASQEASVFPRVIEPATGETKEALERTASKSYEKIRWYSGREFTTFADSMMQLLGGREVDDHTSESNPVISEDGNYAYRLVRTTEQPWNFGWIEVTPAWMVDMDRLHEVDAKLDAPVPVVNYVHGVSHDFINPHLSSSENPRQPGELHLSPHKTFQFYIPSRIRPEGGSLFVAAVTPPVAAQEQEIGDISRQMFQAYKAQQSTR